MKSSYVTKDEIKQARQANIAQYLLSKGIQLIKVGRRYKSKDHDSLVFTDNAYYWNSRQESGNALDYVTKYLNMDFSTAVKELSKSNKTSSISDEKDFTINDIELNPNLQRAIAYLNKSRGIDYKIIQDLVKNKMLFQSKVNSNIVFPIRDENNNIVGAELNGTLSERRYKGIAENSLYGYGFNVRTSENKSLKYYFFYESTIDLLSYINIQHSEGKLKAFKNCLFVSMGGLKINIVHHMLKAFKSDFEPSVFLCVDKDQAGYNFCSLACMELEDIKVTSMISSEFPKNEMDFPVSPLIGKDWNNQLTDINKDFG